MKTKNIATLIFLFTTTIVILKMITELYTLEEIRKFKYNWGKAAFGEFVAERPTWHKAIIIGAIIITL